MPRSVPRSVSPPPAASPNPQIDFVVLAKKVAALDGQVQTQAIAASSNTILIHQLRDLVVQLTLRVAAIETKTA